MAAYRRRIRIEVLVVDAGRAGQRPAVAAGHGNVAPLALGRTIDSLGEPGALRPGKVGHHLGGLVVGEHRDFVVLGKGILQRAQGVVHPGHFILGHALVDHHRHRQLGRVGCKDGDVLAHSVLVDLNVTAMQPRHQVFSVLHGKRQRDVVNPHAQGLDRLRSLARSRLQGRRPVARRRRRAAGCGRGGGGGRGIRRGFVLLGGTRPLARRHCSRRNGRLRPGSIRNGLLRKRLLVRLLRSCRAARDERHQCQRYCQSDLSQVKNPRAACLSDYQRARSASSRPPAAVCSHRLSH